ncbi:MAG: AAA+ ATPase superfamily predicted ATPase [Phenylobacterium sp.]|jgi:AAA+ ATPase superfamily predicted ATPase
MFVGREGELSGLSDAVSKPGGRAKVIVLTGRRRVGKSTLIEQFSTSQKKLSFYKVTGKAPQKENRKANELKHLSYQIMSTFDVPRPVLQEWEDALYAIASYVKGGNCILMIDEVNWFGKTHDDMPGALFTLWELKLKHIKGLTLVLTGSLAGWIQKYIIEDAGWYGRISWQHTLQPLGLIDALAMMPKAVGKRLSNHEKMRFILTSGGVPAYLEQFDFHLPFDFNIQKLAFSEEGYFYNEFDILMNDLFRSKAERIEEILYFLNVKRRTANEISRHLKMNKPNGYLYETLEMMEKSAFIAAEKKWDLKKGKRIERDSFYTICDPYLRFYLKAVLPQKDRIAKKIGKIPNNIDSLLGFQFEHVVRQNIKLVFSALRISASEVIYYAPYNDSGIQIDLLIETTRSFYMVELKYYADLVPQRVIAEMKQKLDRFGLSHNKSVKTAIMHVNGAEDGVINSEYVDFCENIFDHLA